MEKQYYKTNTRYQYEKMILRKKPDHTSFSTKPGTCFIMDTLPYLGRPKMRYGKPVLDKDGNMISDGIDPLDAKKGKQKNRHPFMIIEENKDSVVCCLIQTLECKAEHKNKQHAANNTQEWLESHPYACTLDNAHPPLDDRRYRQHYTDSRRLIEIPKAYLFDADNVQLCGKKGEAVSQQVIDKIKHYIHQYRPKTAYTYHGGYNRPWKKNEDYNMNRYPEAIADYNKRNYYPNKDIPKSIKNTVHLVEPMKNLKIQEYT